MRHRPSEPDLGKGRKPLGLVLAGGAARRMGGGDKAFLHVGGRTIIARIVAALAAQCDEIAINVSEHAHRWRPQASLILSDPIAGRPGPLAGVLAGLQHLAAVGRTEQLLMTVASDVPFLPPDLAVRLAAVRDASGATTAMAASAGQNHPVVALWPMSVRARLEEALLGGGLRSVGAFHDAVGTTVANWPDAPVDPFFNINTPDELAEAERLAQFFGS